MTLGNFGSGIRVRVPNRSIEALIAVSIPDICRFARISTTVPGARSCNSGVLRSHSRFGVCDRFPVNWDSADQSVCPHSSVSIWGIEAMQLIVVAAVSCLLSCS